MAGAVAASLPGDRWAEWLARAGEPWTTETCRWIISGVLIIAGVSFLSAKPFFFLITSALVMLTTYCFDVVVGGRLSGFINTTAGSDVTWRVVPVVALGLGYLIHTSPRAGAPSATGVFSLVLVGFAGVAMVSGWYDQSLVAVASRLGAGAEKFVGEWSEECTWALALILAAIGVAASRTKTVHFLNAILLGALAYQCIRAGCAKVVTFPNANGITIPDMETFSLANVVMWRWVAAGELALLGVILLHLSLGMGALSVAFAFAWMLAGVATFHEIGSLSLVRLLDQAVSQGIAAETNGKPAPNPLGTWGLPLGDPRAQVRPPGAPGGRAVPFTPGQTSPAKDSTGRPAARPPTPAELEQARTEALNSTKQNGSAESASQVVVREVVPLIWIYITAILAGIVGITGFRMLSGATVYRVGLSLGLCAAFAAGCTWLGTKWPRHPDMPWLSWSWVAEFRESQYHIYVIWLVFLGCMALASIRALLLSARTAFWIHASIYGILLGTLLTLVGAAILIRFGGFPRLPTWTIIAIAAGQSSMAWVLLMHLSLLGRSDRVGT